MPKKSSSRVIWTLTENKKGKNQERKTKKKRESRNKGREKEERKSQNDKRTNRRKKERKKESICHAYSSSFNEVG